MLSRFSCVCFSGILWTIELPGSFVHGMLQASILEWVAMPSSRGSFWARDRTCISYDSRIAGGFFTLSHWGSPTLFLLSGNPFFFLLHFENGYYSFLRASLRTCFSVWTKQWVNAFSFGKILCLEYSIVIDFLTPYYYIYLFTYFVFLHTEPSSYSSKYQYEGCIIHLKINK